MSRLILPSRKIWTPPQRQRGYVVLDGYRGGSGSEPDYAHTVLQLHCNGADASSTLTDSSSYARTMTRVGTAEIDTAQSVFGGASAYIPASTNGWTTPGHSSLDMRAGAFQVDWRLRLESGILDDSDSQIDVLMAMVDGSSWAYEWAVIVHRTYLRFYCSIRGVNNRTTRFFLPSGYDMNDYGGAWVPLSIGRDSTGQWGAWIDGHRCPDYQSGNFSSSLSMNSRVNGAILTDTTDFGASAGKLLNIGRFYTFSGLARTKHVDELRYVVGQCRDVTSNYTPLATPFPDS